jgi:sugar/nucleoside kinase (ribokinase family)
LSHQVDFSGTVGDDFLEQLGLVKGIRKVVNHEERGKVLRALDGRSYKLSAGGSLSNTLVALARLGTASTQSRTLNVAMTGSVGSDALGDFYRCALQPFFLSLCWYQCDARHGLKILIFAAWSFWSLICWIWLCRTKLLRAGVHFLSQPVVDGTTGTVIVLTTPDAQRTMLSYQVRLSCCFSGRNYALKLFGKVPTGVII